MVLTIIAFVVCLGVLILVHELGHFLAAKAFKVKVEEFSIGFPPRIATFKRGETKYSIGLLIFGGYVKMLGEEETSKDPRAFNNQTAGKRFIISIAGVVMNFILAWILITTGFIVGMTPMATPSEEIPGQIVKSQIYIVETLPDSAAAKAGLKAGDEIVSFKINDQETALDSLDSVSAFTAAHLGETVLIKIKRDSKELDQSVTLSANAEAPLGVSIFNQGIVKVAWYKAPYVGLKETCSLVGMTFDFLGSFVKQLFTSGKVSDQVGGPVAIFSMSGAAARAGIIVFIQFVAMLSINLALVNILPFPALDGARALLLVFEKIFKKRVLAENVENIVHFVGFAILIILILLISFRDVVRLFDK
jgi:regulator of sigma E protease